MNIDELFAATERYEASASENHRAGSLSKTTLKKMFEIVGTDIGCSLETGCGKSTIFFSNYSKKHLAFCLDDRDMPSSSVTYFENCPAARGPRVEFVFGPTQRTLPRFEFGTPLDVVFIDGPHGYPFPDLEYYYTYPHLKKGGFLLIDDIQIPSIARMADILAEDRMYEVVELIERKTLVLLRTQAPTIDPYSDSWTSQAYNLRRWYKNPQRHLVDGKMRPSFLDLYVPKS
jgi:predicted O-methyltransferase YrrM